MKPTKASQNANGLPVSFLDALGLALAAILLLMFTNLSALQSKTPPPERYHLFVRACFTGLNSTQLWGMHWSYQSNRFLTTQTIYNQKLLPNYPIFRRITLFNRNEPFHKFNEPMLFVGRVTIPTMQVGENQLSMSAIGVLDDRIKAPGHAMQVCYSLDLAFPKADEPKLSIELTPAALPKSFHEQSSTPFVRLLEPDEKCWSRGILVQERESWGEHWAVIKPMPSQIEIVAYSTGAKNEKPVELKYQVDKEEFSSCQPKRMLFLISNIDQQLSLKARKVMR